MNAKTMEGLAGAATNMKLLHTPMRVYKEARRRGDTAVMERAMGYAGEFADKADAYKAEAEEGLKEAAKEAEEKEELQREKALQKRKEEREKQKERIEKSTETAPDTVEISGEGNVLLKENVDLAHTASAGIRADADRTSVIYTKTGEVSQTEQSTGISISV